ncbi:MAG: TylF/MycF/NovP-related O-methyltransferase [Methylocystis sp.]
MTTASDIEVDNYLPTLAGIRHELRGGRNVYEGYQRGWGLEYGDLKSHILADRDYQYAKSVAESRSVVSLERFMNLFLLVKFFLPRLPFGHIVEYGSFRGGSAMFMAVLAERFLPGTNVYALDTFDGMPETDRAIDAHSAGDFADTNIAEIQATVDKAGLGNIRFVKGLFADTAPTLLPKVGSIILAHIDCDIYSAVKYSYEASKPYMVPMGYYVFDDATASSCIGATEAVESFVIARDGLLSEQIYPHFVFRHRGLTKASMPEENIQSRR